MRIYGKTRDTFLFIGRGTPSDASVRLILLQKYLKYLFLLHFLQCKKKTLQDKKNDPKLVLM